jgi:hydrogenase maturation protease
VRADGAQPRSVHFVRHAFPEAGGGARVNLVIGVGNPDRGDDGVGRVVARLLRPHMSVVEHNGEATALVDTLRSAQHTWLIDAAQSGSPPGTIHRIDCTKDMPLLRSTVSSHGFGLAEAIGLARALGTMPPHCTIYAIEIASFTPGAPLSPPVARAALEVANRILAEALQNCHQAS